MYKNISLFNSKYDDTCAISAKVVKVGHSMLIIDYEASENKLLLYNYRILNVIHIVCSRTCNEKKI